MSENDNGKRMTRAATKRKAAAELAVEDDRVHKKRVVLGELPNESNVSVKTNLNQKRVMLVPRVESTVAVDDLESDSDIDSRSDDPQMCGPYVPDIYEYLRQMEMNPKTRPLPDYFKRVQKELKPSMRALLVNWLVEVVEEYKLVSDTLYLAISHLDRYLSLKSVTKKYFQLVGASAMLIASKYEEIKPPKTEDFCYLTENTFTKQEVVKMEADILLALQFQVGRPTIYSFLRRFIRVAQEDFEEEQLEHLCCYLSELSLLDYKSVKFVPSILAASAIFLARFIIRPDQHPWNEMLEEYTKYKASELKACVGILHDLFVSRGGDFKAIRMKYEKQKYQCVANLSVSPELPVTFWEDVTDE